MTRIVFVIFIGIIFAGPQANAQAPAPTEPVVVEKFQEWTFRCFSGRQARCELFQNRLDAQTRRSLFWAELTRHASGKEEFAIITPLGSRVADGLTLSIDGRFSWDASISTCIPLGCLVRVSLNNVLLDRIRRGKILGATLTTFSGEKVSMQMSLDGFASGYARLDKQIKLR